MPQSPVRIAIEIAVNLLLIFALFYWCMKVIEPFIPIVLWAVIIAVATYPLFLKLRNALGGSSKLAATVFAVAGLGIVLVPAWLFADSLIGSASQIAANLEAGELKIPPARENVKDWPVVGAALYENWSAAASDMTAWVQANNDTVRAAIGGLAERAAGVAVSVLQFVVSTLIAAAMLASATSATQGMERVTNRLAGASGSEMLALSTATIRSVAVGVLGVAAIQAVLGGLGMVVMGVPMAGLWALVILVLAIAQLPPWLVLLPAILYVFSANDNNVANMLFAIWSIAVSFSDALLKPLLLGRGVKAPMLVILLGAIGGMLHSGIIGLFIGAVVLALGYTLFQAWLTGGEEVAPVDEPAGQG